MSIEKIVACDGCRATTKLVSSVWLPRMWRSLAVEGGRGSVPFTHHACSDACFARLLRDLADKADPPRAVVASNGGPYR